MHFYHSWADFFNDLWMQLHGPGSFRFILQPIGAAILGIVAGIRDARVGRPPYMFDVLFGTGHRETRLAEGLKAMAKGFLFAVVLDMVFQWVILRKIYVGAALLVGAVLIYLPYALTRGPAERIATKYLSTRSPSTRSPSS